MSQKVRGAQGGKPSTQTIKESTITNMGSFNIKVTEDKTTTEHNHAFGIVGSV